MNIPSDRSYSKTHEWVKFTGENKARIGITDHAQHEMGDIVFVSTAEAEQMIALGSSIAEIESVKAVETVFSPVAGVVAASNAELADAPEKLNETPWDAWIVELADITETEELMSAEAYAAFLKEGA
ncbi:Glycine cleavage system H protein [bioreactor metagenome]|uniref:Glycine cleavage system H protein n=1 Tax=bioreactor metagenome TaxID=1076179 RepID=A0A645C589_9ZZZZ